MPNVNPRKPRGDRARSALSSSDPAQPKRVPSIDDFTRKKGPPAEQASEEESSRLLSVAPLIEVRDLEASSRRLSYQALTADACCQAGLARGTADFGVQTEPEYSKLSRYERQLEIIIRSLWGPLTKKYTPTYIFSTVI